MMIGDDGLSGRSSPAKIPPPHNGTIMKPKSGRSISAIFIDRSGCSRNCILSCQDMVIWAFFLRKISDATYLHSDCIRAKFLIGPYALIMPNSTTLLSSSRFGFPDGLQPTGPLIRHPASREVTFFVTYGTNFGAT